MSMPIKRIFLMLGPKCNLQCKYCLQHDMVDHDSVTVKPEVKKWIQEQVPNNFEPPIIITFYGGEPLVYWDAVKDIVENIRGNIRYNIISNGKLMDSDKVDFINDYDIGVTISWDGINVMKTRGYDVVKNNPSILDIKRLSFSAVLSAHTYPLDFLDGIEPILGEYRRMHGSSAGVNIDTIMDFGNCGNLREMDCSKIEEQMRYIIKNKNNASAYFRIVDGLQKQYVFYRQYIDKVPLCQNGYSVWNVDINGDVYRCHNCGEKVGTIFDDPDKVLEQVRALDPTYKNYQSKCKDCPAQPLCRSGCPLIDSQGREEYYCNIKKAYLTPIIEDAETPKEVGRVIHIE